MGQSHLQPVLWEQGGKPVRPLHRRDRPAGEIILQPDRLGFRAGAQSIEVDVNQRKPATVFMDQHEGRAADRIRRYSQSGRDPSNQGGLPDAQVPDQREYFPSRKRTANGFPESLSVGTRSKNQIHRTGG
jgi:hypothetical protein